MSYLSNQSIKDIKKYPQQEAKSFSGIDYQ